jgi:hypothetical protein
MRQPQPAEVPRAIRPNHTKLFIDAIAGNVVAELLERSPLLAPDSIAEALATAARPLGITGARIFLSDLQQQVLRALVREAGQEPAALDIDSTVAGRAYQTESVQVEPADDDAGGYRIWLPLGGGPERLGVLELIAPDVSADMLARCRMLASLTGLIVAGKSASGDAYARTRRSRDMALQAELAGACMSSRTFATERVMVAAAVAPVYELAGDAFDCSLVADRLNVSVFDACGHDLAAGLLASVALASCRSTRRSGGTLPETVARADRAVSLQAEADRFVTALMCDLDLETGRLAWISCGHPPPLLIRGRQVIRELSGQPDVPLGLAVAPRGRHPGGPAGPMAAFMHTEQLEPGDRLLLYTDGVTEARDINGSFFGVAGLTACILRHADTGMPVSETLRRLNRSITGYADGQSVDDATMVLVEWMPERR